MTDTATTHSSQVGLLEQLGKKMAQIREEHPEWYATYEDEDPITGTRKVLESLLQTAPNDYAAGLITGIMVFRQQLAILTDRSF